MIHELKCHPRFFAALWDRSKPFEVRRDDRDPPFAVGHELRLREWSPGGDCPWMQRDGGVRVDWPRYTGREVRHRVTYVLRHADLPAGVPEGWVVLGLAQREDA